MSAISIDAGTTVIKAVAYDDDGAEVAVCRRSTRVDRPRPGWAEQDMDEVWAAVVSAVQEAAAALPGAPDLVAVTAQGDGAWMLARDGRPTGPAVLWNDGRAADHVAGWERDGILAEAFAITGSRLSTGMPNAILAWLAAHDPDRMGACAALLTCGGWIHHRLTGDLVVDESDASAPYLDVRRRTWSDRSFELYDQEHVRALLPDLRDDDHRVGELGAEAATATGLPAGTAVVLASYDICSTAIGAGVIGAGEACTVLGTTLSTEVVVGAVETSDKEPHGITVALGAPGRWLRAFPTMAGGDVLEWSARLLGVRGPAELVDLAARSAGTGTVRFLPYLAPAGERAPFFDPAARGSLTGLSLDASRDDIALAVLSGLTHTVRECLEAAPERPTTLTLSGGGAANPFWNQLIADVTGLPVRRSLDREVGARGAFLTALVATGSMPDLETAAARHVRLSSELEPSVAAHAGHDADHAEFLRVREALRPVWHGRRLP